MDNGAYEHDRTASKIALVEMGEVGRQQSGPCVAVNGLCASSPNGTTLSKTGRPPPQNPWDKLKTTFLVAIIALLLVWIIAYIIVDRNNMW